VCLGYYGCVYKIFFLLALLVCRFLCYAIESLCVGFLHLITGRYLSFSRISYLFLRALLIKVVKKTNSVASSVINLGFIIILMHVVYLVGM